MGVYPVLTQCPTTTGFSSQIIRLPMTPAISINSLLFGDALETAELGWEIAFEIQMHIALVERYGIPPSTSSCSTQFNL